tara:strand:+ start:592 stop:1512 length:921 start_codon:yes stop_codon:yes gene_type:complete
MTINSIKKVATKYRLLNKIYLIVQTVMLKRRTNKAAANLGRAGINVLNMSELKEKILGKYVVKNDSVCHIIGSGWSLNNSQKRISPADYIIGFNQAAVSGLKFDLYFVEFGSLKEKETSLKQKKLIDEVILPQKGLVVFKNLWADRNEINFIVELWGRSVNYVKDIPVNCYNPKFLLQSMSIFMKNDSEYIRQYSSTALTLVKYAKDIGFKKIVLHGIDFGGKYFFEAEDFHNSNNLTNYLPDKSKTSIYIPSKDSKVHITATSGIGLRESLPIASKMLAKEGVKIYSADSNSPLSQILPIFSSKK